MGRYALAATSLVAAIPAIGLAYVTIMAFVHYADVMPTAMIIVNGAAVAVAVLLAITPVAILVGRRSDKKAAEPAVEAAEGDEGEEGAAPAESAAHTAEVVADEELEEGALSEEMDLDDLDESAETDAFEFDMDELDDDAASADDAFEFDDDLK